MLVKGRFNKTTIARSTGERVITLLSKPWGVAGLVALAAVVVVLVVLYGGGGSGVGTGGGY
jgi:hypothetical protein